MKNQFILLTLWIAMIACNPGLDVTSKKTVVSPPIKIQKQLLTSRLADSVILQQADVAYFFEGDSGTAFIDASPNHRDIQVPTQGQNGYGHWPQRCQEGIQFDGNSWFYLPQLTYKTVFIAFYVPNPNTGMIFKGSVSNTSFQVNTITNGFAISVMPDIRRNGAVDKTGGLNASRAAWNTGMYTTTADIAGLVTMGAANYANPVNPNGYILSGGKVGAFIGFTRTLTEAEIQAANNYIASRLASRGISLPECNLPPLIEAVAPNAPDYIRSLPETYSPTNVDFTDYASMRNKVTFNQPFGNGTGHAYDGLYTTLDDGTTWRAYYLQTKTTPDSPPTYIRPNDYIFNCTGNGTNAYTGTVSPAPNFSNGTYRIFVTFTKANTIQNPTFNLNSTGALPITPTPVSIGVNQKLLLTYNTTSWQITDASQAGQNEWVQLTYTPNTSLIPYCWVENQILDMDKEIGPGQTWFGYRYWLVAVGVPSNLDKYENASIFATNDFVTWATPYKNPVVNMQGGGNNSDPSLIFDPSTMTMYVLIRYTDHNTNISRTYLIPSTDGWQTKGDSVTILINSVPIEVYQTIHYDKQANNWKLYDVVINGTYGAGYRNGLVFYSSPSVSGPYGNRTICNVGTTGQPWSDWQYPPWHIEYEGWDDDYGCYVILASLTTNDDGSGVGSLVVYSSIDGTNWFLPHNYLLRPTANHTWDNSKIYKASWVPLPTDGAGPHRLIMYNGYGFGAESSAVQYRMGMTQY